MTNTTLEHVLLHGPMTPRERLRAELTYTTIRQEVRALCAPAPHRPMCWVHWGVPNRAAVLATLIA
ncbi:MAG TPA: hypothetical protein VFB22_05000 [Candidatus Baltobacteraceae bacterium]|nr:hypothetical protein [Candidatus Baltobacteraceae bacterium]